MAAVYADKKTDTGSLSIWEKYQERSGVYPWKLPGNLTEPNYYSRDLWRITL
jgi:hypothetical protein